MMRGRVFEKRTEHSYFQRPVIRNAEMMFSATLRG